MLTGASGDAAGLTWWWATSEHAAPRWRNS